MSDLLDVLASYGGLDSLLNQNQDKHFVKRILTPEKYPVLPLGNGTIATHMMMWGQAGDKYVVFPSVVHDGQQLVRLNPDQAFDRAMKSGGFIEFNSPQEADWFSKNYKRYWDK
jgi:hypothetical protein